MKINPQVGLNHPAYVAHIKRGFSSLLHTEAIAISEAFLAGANGYVLKQSAAEELRVAIESVLANKRFLSQKIAPEVREALEHDG